MKIFQSVILAFAFAGIFQVASAQIEKSDLLSFNQKRMDISRTGMITLGGWAVGNFLISGLLISQAEGSTKAFHQMNVGWNLVNISLAGFGYYHALRTDPAASDLYETIAQQYSQEKTFLFNGGLDVGYMLGGLFLMEKSRNASKNQNLLKGFGQSILLQGGFLFVFDMAMFFILHHHGLQLKPLLEKITLTGSVSGMGVIYTF